MTIAHLAASAAVMLTALNLIAMALAVARWKRRPGPDTDGKPPVSILRPLRGLEPFSEETIAATFALDWPDYEIIFCVQSATDPVIALVEAAIARHGGIPARLFIGNDVISANPKLNNCAKGWRKARHGWIVMADSNVLMPRDCVARLMRVVTPDTCLVISMPWGTRPCSFWAEVECMLLNTFQARWQYAAAALGQPFAQGKNMMWRRNVLDGVGGLGVLGQEPAEDAAATRLVRALGQRMQLVDVPFEQPLGHRTMREVWSRHTRWARLRRATFALYYLPECLNGALPPVALAIWGASATDMRAVTVAALVALALYGAELALIVASGMTLRWATLPAMIVRDLMMPAMYVDAWLFDGFTWHGQAMSVTDVAPDATSIGG